MEIFFRIHKTLVGQYGSTRTRRGLLDEIDLSARLVGIRGARGVGKTTLLLQIAELYHSEENRECLYVNLNHLYFADRTILDFGREFYAAGGKRLLLDQVFKYPTWAEEIRMLLDQCPELSIVFTTSAVTPSLTEIEPISSLVQEYQLQGFSFREFINARTGKALPRITLEDLFLHHEDIAPKILEEVNVPEFYNDYLKRGYYPSTKDGQQYYEQIVKALNMSLEVDVIYLAQVDPSYLGKLRKLAYILTTQGGQVPNISLLSNEIGTSRATLLNYILDLSRAGIIHLVRKQGEENSSKKMGQVFAYNTNLLQVLYPHIPSREMERLVFLLSHLTPHYKVATPIRKMSADIIVEDKIQVSVKETGKIRKKQNITYAVDHLSVGRGNEIPTWLFGFLY